MAVPLVGDEGAERQRCMAGRRSWSPAVMDMRLKISVKGLVPERRRDVLSA